MSTIAESSLQHLRSIDDPIAFPARKKRIKPSSIAILAFLTICALFFCVPLYVIVVTSLKSMDQIRQGDIFGELSFFDHEARSADIRAVEKSESLVLTPESFARLQAEQPQLAIELLLKIGAVASRRFRAHNRKLAAVGMIAPHMAW